MSNAVLHYDFTMNNPNLAYGSVVEALRAICRQWAFQKEEGELRGTPHYQGRIVLKEKLRLITLRNKLAGGPLAGCHLSPTSKANTGNQFYVMKEAGRLEGPWTDKTQTCYIPLRVRNLNLYPWEKKLEELAAEDNDRVIHVVIDTTGGIGKSTFVTYMDTHGKGCLIPPMNSHKDVMRMVMCMPKSRCYMIDLPKASDKQRMRDMWCAIETVKSGYAYDDRYAFKREFFEPPAIMVFTNMVPDRSLLSDDRWVIWSIVNDELVPYE